MKSVLNDEPFLVALFFALVLHVFIIAAVGFAMPDPSQPPVTKTLGVVLLQTTTDNVVKDADYIAQAAHEGSGHTADTQRPTTTTEAVFPDYHVQDVAEMPERNAVQPQQTVNDINRLTTEQAALQQINTVPPHKPETLVTESNTSNDPLTAPSLTDTKRLALLREMSSLQAEIDRETHDILTRETEVNLQSPALRAKYDVAAPYINEWIAKVKLLSDEDYLLLLQEETQPSLLNGTVTINVVLNPNGTLQKLQVLEPSGHDKLDLLALRSIRRGMPYPPFPSEITQQYKTLSFRAEFEFKHNLTQSQ